MSGSFLKTEDLNFHYEDSVPVLKGLNFKIERGQTTALIGGNGAGKTTIFLCLNGILKPVSGKVIFDGKQLDYSRKGLIKLRSRVGIVFQDPDDQLFSASVTQDVSFGPMNLKLPESEVLERVNLALQRTGTLHLKERPTHSLSFGEKKRVAIAGVLAMEPEVLILDEPTSGLDPAGVSEIMKLLKHLKESLGLTVLFATHDIDLVPLYADYAYVLDRGSLILKGTPKEIFKEKELLRSVSLRLPRIGHLMEILEDKDGFLFSDRAATIGEARRVLKDWQTTQCKKPAPGRLEGGNRD